MFKLVGAVTSQISRRRGSRQAQYDLGDASVTWQRLVSSCSATLQPSTSYPVHTAAMAEVARPAAQEPQQQLQQPSTSSPPLGVDLSAFRGRLAEGMAYLIFVMQHELCGFGSNKATIVTQPGSPLLLLNAGPNFMDFVQGKDLTYSVEAPHWKVRLWCNPGQSMQQVHVQTHPLSYGHRHACAYAQMHRYTHA